MRSAWHSYPGILVFLCALVLGACAPDSGEGTARPSGASSSGRPEGGSDAEAAGGQPREIVSWSFANGLYPDGWGWGEWTAEDGALVGQHKSGWIACYFTPFPCPADFSIETRVMFIAGEPGKPVSAQLLVRDSEELIFESGMALYPDQDAVSCRHRAWRREFLDEMYPAGMPIDYGRWYKLCFSMERGRLRAELDGRRLPLPDVRYPVSAYFEPHLAVENGSARFDHVRILALR